MRCLVARPTSGGPTNDRLPHRHDQRDAEQRNDDADDPLVWPDGGVPARLNSPLDISSDVIFSIMGVDVDLSASEAREVLLSHLSARAVDAVRLLIIALLDLEMLMKVIPSASTTAPFAIRARMNDVAGFTHQTAGSELPPGTRTIAIT